MTAQNIQANFRVTFLWQFLFLKVQKVIHCICFHFKINRIIMRIYLWFYKTIIIYYNLLIKIKAVWISHKSVFFNLEIDHNTIDQSISRNIDVFLIYPWIMQTIVQSTLPWCTVAMITVYRNIFAPFFSPALVVSERI